MNENEMLQKITTLQDKLNKAQKQLIGLKEKSKCMERSNEDSRTREQNTNQLVMELLERQRELNVMLNRSNIMLNRTQEAMALTSFELNEMAKALPEPKKEEWSERVNKINDIFKKTGIQDAEITGMESKAPALSDSFSRDEMKKESEEAFGKHESIWLRKERHEPPNVEAIPMDDESAQESIIDHDDNIKSEIILTHGGAEVADENREEDSEDEFVFGAPKKSWWQKIAG